MSPLPVRGISFVIPGGDGGTSHPPHLQGEEVTKAGDAWGQRSGTAPRDLGEERQQGSQVGLDGDGDLLR